MRKPIIAGNWKMHYVRDEAKLYVETIRDRIDTDKAEVVLCVPNILISAMQKWVEGTNIKVAAQNMHYMEQGAYTGEVSGKMLKGMGVPYVIIGHSERREYFNETDADVNKKVKKAIAEGITPIICVGEVLEQRWELKTIGLVRKQVGIALKGVSAEDAKKTVIAYEPVWAIGTGMTATSAQAEEVCRAIREMVCELYCCDVSQAIRIQYGGSVNAANAAELFSMPNIDGGLVGGASLKPEFEKVVNFGG